MLNGKKLKILRIEQDIEAQYIAATLGISKSYISIMEREKQAIPEHLYKKWIIILKGDER